MDASGQNYKDTFRYTDVEYTPDGHTDVYRWDDFPVLFDGERVIEAFDGSPVHMSVPVEVDGEKVWTCGYDFCWGETVAPDFSRARGRFPDATVAAWAAERSVNGSDVNLGIKERML